MTDSDQEQEDQEKLEYLKKDLFQPSSRPWHQYNQYTNHHHGQNGGGGGGGRDDKSACSPSDDSNHMFMSEPSVSEADSSDRERHLRLLSPVDMESLTDDQSVDDDGLPPPPPPAAAAAAAAPRLLLATTAQLTTQSPASPGGNTSLSSWESPHLSRRIHIHYSPDPIGEGDPERDDIRYNNNPPYLLPRGFVHPSQYAAIASPQQQQQQQHRTPDRDFASDNQQSSASTTDVSSGQRRQAMQFLHDLRVSSEGQFGESCEGADYSFDSSYQVPNSNNRRDRVQNVLRTTVAENNNNPQYPLHEEEKQPITRTELIPVRDTSSTDLGGLTAFPGGDGHANPTTDDTIVMTLSDSGDERETNDSHQPLDWEKQQQQQNSGLDDQKIDDWDHNHHSADDELTAELKPRARSQGKNPPHRRQRSFGDRKQPGHRRQRSGDAAAATLSTGSASWKGMGQDKIPLPPVPGEEDDDDDDDDDNDNHHSHGNEMLEQQGRDKIKPNHFHFGKSTVDSVHPSFGIPSDSAGDIAQFSRFALGDDAPAVAAAARRPSSNRRYRRDVRPRKKIWLEVDSEESSSSIKSGDVSPRYTFHTQQNSRHSRVASHPILPSGFGVSPTSWQAETMSPYSYSSQQYGHPSAPFGIPPNFRAAPFNYEQLDPNYSPRWQSGGWQRKGSFDQVVANNARHPAWFPSMKTERPSAPTSWDQGPDSPSSTFSWLSAIQKTASFMQKKEVDPESQSLLEKQSPKVETIKSDDRDNSYGFPSDSESEGESSTDMEAVDRFNAHMNHENGPSLRVVRPNVSFNNPFKNPPNQEFDRRKKFSVMTTATPDDEKQFPTYICPVCNTRQREFFTVSSAPKTFESASGYIAFYFSIYVIAALYLFGLQEGWSNLDCIYFAVITLTTAGLGDFVPTTDGAKIICSVFIYFGVACIGLLLGSYIAGMLDETSSRTARENRIKSCPNCSRIRNIKIAAERRQAASSVRHEPTPSPHKGGSGFFSVRINKTDTSLREFEPDSKKLKRHVEDSPGTNSGTFAAAPHTADGRSYMVSPGHSALHPHASPGPAHGEFVQANSLRSPVLPGISPVGGVSPRLTPGRSNNLLGSPMTTQILRRQSHSRHASIDIGGTNSFAAAFSRPGSERARPRFSATLPATIQETGSQDQQVTPPPPPTGEWEAEDASDDTFDTESSDSESDESESKVDEHKNDKMKNAKYVLMTLKEALLNSVVIITFGCMGFCFIEGFSIIDSWYFTTVLLTTVGYGDICPYTKGGKLFATIYILVAGTILLNNMSMISMIPLELRKRRTEKAVLEQFGDWLDDAALRELATGPLVQRLNLSYQHPTGLDECTREMFSLAMLVRLGKVTEEDIKQTFAAFRKLDIHDEGVLNSRSIIAGMIQKHRTSCINLQRLANPAVVQQRQQVPQRQQQPVGIPLNGASPQGFPGAPGWGYGSLYGGSVGMSYQYGAPQAAQMPAVSERSIINPMGANYGSGLPENPHELNRARTGSA